MTLDECEEDYLETGNTLYKAYDQNDESIIAEITWRSGYPQVTCYINYWAHNDQPRQIIADPDIDTWCPF